MPNDLLLNFSTGPFYECKGDEVPIESILETALGRIRQLRRNQHIVEVFSNKFEDFVAYHDMIDIVIFKESFSPSTSRNVKRVMCHNENCIDTILLEHQVQNDFAALIFGDFTGFSLWKKSYYLPSIVIAKIDTSLGPYVQEEYSFSGMLELANEKGYLLVAHEGSDVVFIRADLVKEFNILKPVMIRNPVVLFDS